ncbi:hypothetical protein [Streptomyces sp. MUSC 14]|uniref:hypothetical protein n=1 Tax=Streptomyces sp. MUSC 14 TaxID=1354889 RepID=UPI0015A60885|nr:hypothetical protein [Streptomyces sp. MUSC 14]
MGDVTGRDPPGAAPTVERGLPRQLHHGLREQGFNGDIPCVRCSAAPPERRRIMRWIVPKCQRPPHGRSCGRAARASEGWWFGRRRSDRYS